MQSKKEYYLGKEFLTNEGYKVKVIDYVDNTKATILFENGYSSVVQVSNLIKGTTKNPFHPNIYGVGYVGSGKHNVTEEGVVCKKYKTWNSMFNRCYSKKLLVAYQECRVDKRWHNFQVFGDWYDKKYKTYMDSNWHLDKDILQKGNKIYSPETCCFVPQEINKLFTKRQNHRGAYPIGVMLHKKTERYVALINTGINQEHLGSFSTPKEAFNIYKDAKECQIKKVATEYYSLRRIPLEVYEAMYNYKVEITD